MTQSLEAALRSVIREIPNFPKPGINFYDVASVMNDGKVFARVTEAFHDRYAALGIDSIVGIDARGFVFGAALAHALKLGFIPVRKAGKLPPEVEQIKYALEYGHGELEIHRHAIRPGLRVIVVDDLLATGGTAKATGNLVSRLGGIVLECAFVVELAFLGGRKVLDPMGCFSLITYDK